MTLFIDCLKKNKNKFYFFLFLQSNNTMKKTGSKKTNERNPKKIKLNAENKETKPSYFDCLPIDMEIVIFSFVISEMNPWDRNWNNISLVSKHWNSIAWIFFQRTIPKSEKETIFTTACGEGKIHFVNKLLIQDITFDPSFQDNIAIRIGSSYEKTNREGFIDIVKRLLQDKRVDPSDDNNYAIKAASGKGFSDIVKFLLQDKRVDPSDDNNFAIEVASERGFTDIVELLLQDNRVDPSDDNNGALKIACLKRRTDIIKLLLKDKRVDPSPFLQCIWSENEWNYIFE